MIWSGFCSRGVTRLPTGKGLKGARSRAVGLKKGARHYNLDEDDECLHGDRVEVFTRLNPQLEGEGLEGRSRG